MHKVYGELSKYENFPLPDESLMSYTFPQALNMSSTAVMSCVVIHLHFGMQTEKVNASGIYNEISKLLDEEGAPSVAK